MAASEPTLVPPGGGEVVGDAPDRRVEILRDDETLQATWSRCGFGTFLRVWHGGRTDEAVATARAAFDQLPA